MQHVRVRGVTRVACARCPTCCAAGDARPVSCVAPCPLVPCVPASSRVPSCPVSPHIPRVPSCPASPPLPHSRGVPPVPRAPHPPACRRIPVSPGARRVPARRVPGSAHQAELSAAAAGPVLRGRDPRPPPAPGSAPALRGREVEAGLLPSCPGRAPRDRAASRRLPTRPTDPPDPPAPPDPPGSPGPSQTPLVPGAARESPGRGRPPRSVLKSQRRVR